MTRASYIRVVTALLAAVGVAALVLVTMASAGAKPAQAQDTTGTAGTTIKVNTIEDESNGDGDCSLREAIEAADTNAAVDKCKAGSATERDAVHFSLGKKATIVLGSQLPAITDASGLTINGQKAKITVSGNDQVRVFRVDSGAKLTLARLTVADGHHSSFGGGIFNRGTLKVTDSTFSGNNATLDGGGIANAVGTLEVTNSTFSGNNVTFTGGAIDNWNASTLEVTNSTFSGNSAEYGGAIRNSGTLGVTNSTFSGNSASEQRSSGGAIFNIGTATLRNTILANTIVVNSPTDGNCAREGDPITDGGYNIDDGISCGFSDTNNSQPDTDPLLNPKGLQNRGGPTQTIQLLKGSPAISVIPEGANGCGTEIKTDQRGVKRPQGKGCDIGAFEKKKR